MGRAWLRQRTEEPTAASIRRMSAHPLRGDPIKEMEACLFGKASDQEQVWTVRSSGSASLDGTLIWERKLQSHA